MIGVTDDMTTYESGTLRKGPGSDCGSRESIAMGASCDGDLGDDCESVEEVSNNHPRSSGPSFDGDVGESNSC